MKSSQTVRLVLMAMLAAISVVLVMLLRTPLLMAAPHLEYDMADVPVLLGTMMFGILPGLCILLIVSVIQAFLLGGNGWIGLLMHFVASGVLVVVVGLFHCRNIKWWKTILGMVLGTIAMAVVMVPMNLIIAPIFFGSSMKDVVEMLVPIIIPFNLLKAGINCVITFVLLKALTPITSKNSQLFLKCKINQLKNG
ncbi:MAG: ECF transporter S component [Oscillospiraceae bacterium]|nr:ECF transporter S component [Oscillospiraceae bacterium]